MTESQYMALRDYEDGRSRWTNGGPPASLVMRGWIRSQPHDRTMFQITPAGLAALAWFRTRHGVA